MSENTDVEAEKIKMNKLDKMMKESNKPVSSDIEHTVIVYSTSTCPWCVRVKSYFDSKNVKYTDYNVGENHEKAMEMIQKTGQQGVPVIDIDGQMIIGFNKLQIDQLLGL